MNNFLKVAIFSLLMVGAFAGYSNFGIPQIEPAPPPVEEKLDLGAMTMDQFVALGDKIFHGKGTCTLCHNEMGRAPMLDKIGTVAHERLGDPRYQGEATNVEEYLHESFVKPSAFVVAGFGKSGTNDTESPMPDVSGGGIGMSDAEIAAVIAYLQDISGSDITVSIPTDVPEEGGDEESEGGGRAPLESAEAIIAEFGCGACHKVAGETGEMGPDLTHIGALRGKDHLRRALLDPNAEISEGFMEGMMPDTYGTQLSGKELEMLVDYLAGLK
ncbi:MAG: c-type cytochrome [Gammaproteobacteria bacterium]|nr:c-type cytochrome [Gammaproteobacteria bacterium]